MRKTPRKKTIGRGQLNDEPEGKEKTNKNKLPSL